MKFRILTAILIMLFLWSCKEEIVPVVEYKIIPHPHKTEYKNGNFKFTDKLSVAYTSNLVNEANLLKQWFSSDFGVNVTLQEGTKANIILSIDESVMLDSTDAYILDITKKAINIKANSPTGVLHGIQTLRQVVRAAENEKLVQAGVITDYPTFAWRAFMLDEGRYFKGKEVVYKLLDEMSMLKMNVFHWHLTNDQGWRIEIKKYPKLTEIGAYRDSSEINHFHSNVYDGKPHGGFYTQDEIKDVVKYAADRHITVMPEICMPGHACAAIAAYPWLGTSGKQIKVPGQFGVHYDVFNVADPKVMRFFEDVIDEVIALFPAPVFHIGGDEVKYDEWKDSKSVQAYMKEHNLKTPADLQIFFTNNISNILASKGKKMMGWNEITGAKLHEYQSAEDTHDVGQQLAKGSIVHFWKGDPNLMKQAVASGYDMVNSYHIYTYLDYSYKLISLEKAYTFNIIPEGITAEQQKHVLGLGCQMWGEFIPTVESMNLKVYPRIAAYAENGWTSAGNKDYNRFVGSLDFFLKKWEAESIKYGQID